MEDNMELFLKVEQELREFDDTEEAKQMDREMNERELNEN